jgi:hypothetical protein
MHPQFQRNKLFTEGQGAYRMDVDEDRFSSHKPQVEETQGTILHSV